MKTIARAALACALAAAFATTIAHAQRIIRINDNVTLGFFSQPTIVQDGTVGHVAYIGADNASGPFRLYYAAVYLNGDFTNLALARSTIVLVPPVVVADTVGSPRATFADARHPRIALRANGRPVIFFQARPNSAFDNAFALYRALIRVDNNAVTSQAVSQVAGSVTPGDIENVSFALIPYDNDARVAFSNRSAIAAPEPFNVYYARVGLDNALMGTPHPLSLPFLSGGSQPLPHLRLDGLNQSHIAWSSDPWPNSASIHYAMIKLVNNVDNVVIPSTRVLSSMDNQVWRFPAALPLSTQRVMVTAIDEGTSGSSGQIGFVEIYPPAAKQDGRPVELGIGDYSAFMPQVPGKTLLPSLTLSRPETAVDISDRIHMTGLGNPPGYVAFRSTGIAPYWEFVTSHTDIFPDGNNENAAEIPGDFTTAALLHLSGRNMIVWSGVDNVNSAFTNMNVTAVPGAADPLPSSEHGCSVARGPRGGDSGGAARATMILLPAAVLLARRILRRRRGRLGE